MTGMSLTCRHCGNPVPLVEPYHRNTGGLRCACGAWLIDPGITYCIGAYGAGISAGGCKDCGPDSREPGPPDLFEMRNVTFRDDSKDLEHRDLPWTWAKERAATILWLRTACPGSLTPDLIADSLEEGEHLQIAKPQRQRRKAKVRP